MCACTGMYCAHVHVCHGCMLCVCVQTSVCAHVCICAGMHCVLCVVHHTCSLCALAWGVCMWHLCCHTLCVVSFMCTCCWHVCACVFVWHVCACKCVSVHACVLMISILTLFSLTLGFSLIQLVCMKQVQENENHR